jgi:hypothetical protein
MKPFATKAKPSRISSTGQPPGLRATLHQTSDDPIPVLIPSPAARCPDSNDHDPEFANDR